jgi:hypothetical protein
VPSRSPHKQGVRITERSRDAGSSKHQFTGLDMDFTADLISPAGSFEIHIPMMGSYTPF